jgi:predicted sulfurtransferase
VQLEGGILKYLELEGRPYWHGECFVFDDRAALDDKLAPARNGAPRTVNSMLDCAIECMSDLEAESR